MAVVEVWTPRGVARITGGGYGPEAHVDADPGLLEPLRDLAVAAVLCSAGRAVERDGRWVAQGDPMEAALDAFARRLGAEGPAHAHALRSDRRFPFDPRRRRMSLVTAGRVLVKGAPDAVLPRCLASPEEARAAERALEDLAARGLRVLAVAARHLPEAGALPASADVAEDGLQLLGLVGLEDPPRPHAAAAIAAVRHAGIKVAMITGDHPQTAAAIAREVGICGPDGPVLVGADLPADGRELGRRPRPRRDRRGPGVARAEAADRPRAALAGHVVAMTGDGVNDGPALQEADIGIAMGRSGTDVAREAADLVLLDDDFATIVAAVEQGRATFANIRRFLTYHLTDNVAELTPFVVWALSAGQIPLALGVLQVLALDIGTDIAPAAALGAEPASRHALEGRPRRGHLLDRSVLRRSFGVLGPTEAIVEMAAFFATFWAVGWRPGDGFPEGSTLLMASGAAFTAVVLGQAANAFACRSASRPPWRLARPANRLLIGAVAAMIVLLVGFLFIPPIADLLGQAPPERRGLRRRAAGRARRAGRGHARQGRAAAAEAGLAASRPTPGAAAGAPGRGRGRPGCAAARPLRPHRATPARARAGPRRAWPLG